MKNEETKVKVEEMLRGYESKIKKPYFSHLTEEMRKTQFYKMMFEMYDKLLGVKDWPTFFLKKDDKSKSLFIDNIINTYLEDQYNYILNNVQTVVQSSNDGSEIDNKDEEFDGEGMGDRSRPYKDKYGEDGEGNKIILRVVEKKDGMKTIRTMKKPSEVIEIFLKEKIKNKVELTSDDLKIEQERATV